MKFNEDALTEEQETKLYSFQCHAGSLIRQQKEDGLYLPLIVSGNTGAGKDTIVEGMRKVLEEILDIPFPHTASRFSTRPPRPSDTSNPLQLISLDDFISRELGFTYEFAGNLYGLDGKILRTELETSNRVIINGNPRVLAELQSEVQSTYDGKYVPGLIYARINQEDNLALLNKRKGTPGEAEARKREILQSQDIDVRWITNPIYRKSHLVLDRRPSMNHDENQVNFNQDVLRCVQHTLGYISSVVLDWRHAPENRILGQLLKDIK